MVTIKKKHNTVEEETKHIVETAANIMRNDMKVLYRCTNYPNSDKIIQGFEISP